MQENKAFNAWAKDVVDFLNSKDEKLFQEAVDSVQEEYDSPGPTEPYALLEWMRGDEPEEACEAGGSAEEYADFLLTVWDLYGP